MEENNFVQFIEKCSSIAKRLHISVSPDGKTIFFARNKILRWIISCLGYSIIVFSLLAIVLGIIDFAKYGSVILFFVFPLLAAICVLRKLTRKMTFSASDGQVCITGQLRKKLSLKWSHYLNAETVFSVTDIPEEIFINFQNGSSIKRIKLTDITPFLRQYNPENYSAIKKLWECVEYTMSPKEDVASEEIQNI